MPTQFALLGPSEKHCLIQGGFCMSAFAIIKKDSRVLLVKPRDHPRWKEEWAPNWRLYDTESLSNEFRSWRFPSSYVREGESPEDTLTRLVKEQLGISSLEVMTSRLLNFYGPSRMYPDKMHWDYCFVYDVKVNETPTLKPWYSALEYADLRTLDAKDFGSSQGGLLRAI
ncbi:MAG: NUDIX domain-containing protein [Nitrososphaerales archaeon]